MHPDHVTWCPGRTCSHLCPVSSELFQEHRLHVGWNSAFYAYANNNLGDGGIMFFSCLSGCPSVHFPSVRCPSINTWVCLP